MTAEAIVQRHLAAAENLESDVDATLAVLANPAELYRRAPDSVQRQLVQELFEKIWILDQKLVGADLTRPYLELLGTDAAAAAEAVNDVPGSGQISYDRRDQRIYLRIERPVGALAADVKNPRPDNLAEGSNMKQLVGLTGFEPAASSSRTRRATKLRHSPMCAERAGSQAREHTGAGAAPGNRYRCQDGRGTRDSSVASGRQATRIRA